MEFENTEEEYEDMQSSVGQHQMEAGEQYYEYVELLPQRKTERQDSVPSTQQPRTRNAGGDVVPNPSYLTHQSSNLATTSHTPPPLYEYLPESEAWPERDRATQLAATQTAELPHMKALSISPSSIHVDDDRPKFDTSFKSPVGYNIMNLMSQGNVIFILPKTSIERKPLYLNRGFGERVVHGGGSFTDESRFVVTIPREHTTEHVIALESFKYKGRYLCVDRRGRIKARDGYKDSCDFFVYGVNGSPHLVYFESARSDGFYFGMRSDNSPSDAASITADSEEAHFGILTDNVSESSPLLKLEVFGTNSIMDQVRDKSVIRLFSQRRYLGIDRKGRVLQTHNDKNTDSWFMVHDRGMGILSLRSYVHQSYWLKMQDGQLTGKGKPGLDTFFQVRESVEHQIILESIAQPGTFVYPSQASPSVVPEFTVEVILEKPTS
ncbi:uncharacterized protein LOC135344380 isoform X2 [Halichondria panicea]|uniref:uncharacterized protein LOC135344380 isoform X2 n=1 Tax=Halichondria panicea TaxID=6063 RepID=UPI00312B631E